MKNLETPNTALARSARFAGHVCDLVGPPAHHQIHVTATTEKKVLAIAAAYARAAYPKRRFVTSAVRKVGVAFDVVLRPAGAS